jgi:hypothetical protein
MALDLEQLRTDLARILTDGLRGGTPARVSPYGTDLVDPAPGGVHLMIEADSDSYITYAATFARSGQATVRFRLVVFASITSGAESGQRILDRFLSVGDNESLWLANWTVGDNQFVFESATRVGERQAIDSAARFTVAEIPVVVRVSKGA